MSLPSPCRVAVKRQYLLLPVVVLHRAVPSRRHSLPVRHLGPLFRPKSGLHYLLRLLRLIFPLSPLYQSHHVPQWRLLHHHEWKLQLLSVRMNLLKAVRFSFSLYSPRIFRPATIFVTQLYNFSICPITNINT